MLGFPLPDAPTVLAILTGWRLDLLVIGTLLAAAILYGRGLVTLHRRGDRWPVGRAIAWYAGLAFVAFGTLSGLAVYGRASFSMHMTQHMTLSMIAPLLLVLGAPITLALRALPAARSNQPAGAREWLLAALQSPFGRVLTHPITALVLFISAPYMIYFSGLFETAMRAHWAHELMHVHFVLVGFLFYESLIGSDPVPYRASYPMRMVTIFAALAFHAFFAVALISSDTVIAASYYETLNRAWWPNLLEDQTNGASFAWAFGELPGFSCSSCCSSSGHATTTGRPDARTVRPTATTTPSWPRTTECSKRAATGPRTERLPSQTIAGRETPMPPGVSEPNRAISRSMSRGAM